MNDPVPRKYLKFKIIRIYIYYIYLSGKRVVRPYNVINPAGKCARGAKKFVRFFYEEICDRFILISLYTFM